MKYEEYLDRLNANMRTINQLKDEFKSYNVGFHRCFSTVDDGIFRVFEPSTRRDISITLYGVRLMDYCDIFTLSQSVKTDEMWSMLAGLRRVRIEKKTYWDSVNK